MISLRSIFLSIACCTAALLAQAQDPLEHLLKEKQFLALDRQNTDTGHPLHYYYKAVFASVCNQPVRSNAYLDSLSLEGLSSAMLFDYWALRNDNHVKCHNYKEAYRSNHLLNTQYASQMGKSDREGSLQSEKIWETLQDVPPQRILRPATVSLPLGYDAAGLMTLGVCTRSGQMDFVFDTGAGISAITSSAAVKLGFTILEGDGITVKGFSGIGNAVRMATIDTLRMGEVAVVNPVFLVLEDAALSFAGGAYQIHGIVGFPIAKDWGTLTLEKDRLVIGEEDRQAAAKNLFVELLHPILFLELDGKALPFNFDTGAKESILSRTFYQQYRKTSLLRGLKPSTSEVASAGGSRSYRQLVVPSIDFTLGGEPVRMTDVQVDMSHYHVEGKELYGNIGQDLLRQYSKVVISFSGNYLRLER